MRDELALLLFTRYLAKNLGKRKKRGKKQIKEKSEKKKSTCKYENKVSFSC